MLFRRRKVAKIMCYSRERIGDEQQGVAGLRLRSCSAPARRPPSILLGVLALSEGRAKAGAGKIVRAPSSNTNGSRCQCSPSLSSSSSPPIRAGREMKMKRARTRSAGRITLADVGNPQSAAPHSENSRANGSANHRLPPSESGTAAPHYKNASVRRNHN